MASTWTSGAFDTSNQYIKYKIYITQNSQNTSTNKSNVTVKVKFYRTNTGYTTYGSGTVTCVINGTTYTASVDSNDKITNSGIYLFSKTLNIAHNDDGTKTLTVKAKISHNQFTASYHTYKHALTTIPRKSTLSVANGTLGTKQTLTVTRKADTMLHTITYSCGSASGTICSASESTSISFTPPLSLASQNTTGTTVSIKYTITTYSGYDLTNLGSNSYTVTCSIPASVKPGCSIAVSDPTGYASTYGGYIKGLSKIKVVVTGTLAYGSAIASYKTTANGGTYTASSFTTGAVASTGTLTISASVTDKRGRSGTASKTITALAYTKPTISKLTVGRCDEDGTANQQGAYVKVTFSASVTSLNSKNKATYTIQYKKTSASAYGTAITLSSYANNYAVSNGSYIFAAESDASYDVKVNVADNFYSGNRTTSVSTAFTLLHFSAGGTGLAIGKIVEEENLLDIGLPVRFRKGAAPKILWSSAFYMHENQTASLSELVSTQLSGIVLVFSAYADGAAQNYNWNYFFISKYHVQAHNGAGTTFMMSGTGFQNMACKYLYIYDNEIKGHASNDDSGTSSSGIVYDNTAYVLRYVVGV